ncbi:hypothetical protein EXM22_01820 [Oceanispirochaeta crateris]|uniref:Uncharacterized protein n=1 Tax=Oceanispirochaeta crateris TaxID=2518645 RepID=A0A5C1QHN4_9SPIO|nr:hypothetical protein [Oceanispirochaeta crateris]QEN06788.1 hypothetical protein EXM22_01820 [Oceanispirochaeta crateris]
MSHVKSRGSTGQTGMFALRAPRVPIGKKPAKESRNGGLRGVGVKTDGDAGADVWNRSGVCRDRRTAAEQHHREPALELRLEKREWKVRRNNTHFLNNQ